jgi:hypothetical protein
MMDSGDWGGSSWWWMLPMMVLMVTLTVAVIWGVVAIVRSSTEKK